MSWRGLSSLVGGICSGRGVVSVLDIRGNSDVTGGDVMCGERDLRESGLRCLLKWHTASSSSSVIDPSTSLWDSGSSHGEGEGVQTAAR
jgi:hypothetical protein